MESVRIASAAGSLRSRISSRSAGGTAPPGEADSRRTTSSSPGGALCEEECGAREVTHHASAIDASRPRVRGLPGTWELVPRVCGSARVAVVAVVTLASAWAAGFGYLAVMRHLAGGSHAEDLGFTDQVI